MKNERCPTCAHAVESVFDHIAIDCEHGMTKEQIEKLLLGKEALSDEEYLLGLSDRIMNIAVQHGVDQYDCDRLKEISAQYNLMIQSIKNYARWIDENEGIDFLTPSRTKPVWFHEDQWKFLNKITKEM